MKINFRMSAYFLLCAVLLSSMFFMELTSSEKMAAMGGYDPWIDNNDDGEIDIFDAIALAGAFGSSGTPLLAKAALEYESSWIDITDKCGEYFNITHNFNSTDIIVDVTGKTTTGGGVHQRYIGGTGFVAGWNETYGGPNTDIAYSVIQTDDGGYAIAGSTMSFGAGGYDVYLIKTDSTGNSLWNRTYGGADDDGAMSVVQTADGGYALAAYTWSFGAGNGDIWLVKTDSTGNSLWNKTYGGPNVETVRSVVLTNDGGYAVAGTTPSFGAAGGDDFWLVKTDATGNAQWNKTYGGTGAENLEAMIQTGDSGYALIGFTQSYGAGFRDFWLVKTDQAGTTQWNKTYGGVNEDWGIGVIETIDGGYALTGFTWSFGDSRQAWLLKTDSVGNTQWNKTIGGTAEDGASKLVQTNDGGYALAAWTLSFGVGNWDCWLVKTDATGNVQWNKTYGGPNSDSAYSVVQTFDQGYAVAGVTDSFGAGGTDMWLIKTDAAGNAKDGFNYGLAWTDSTTDAITLYRGATDAYWNYVRVRIWKIK